MRVRSSMPDNAAMPMTGGADLRLARSMMSPTSFMTPEFVPPVTIHVFKLVAAMTNPSSICERSIGVTVKFLAPPVIDRIKLSN